MLAKVEHAIQTHGYILPDDQSKTVFTLKKGEEVMIVSNKAWFNKYIEIMNKDGLRGYINKDFLGKPY